MDASVPCRSRPRRRSWVTRRPGNVPAVRHAGRIAAYERSPRALDAGRRPPRRAAGPGQEGLRARVRRVPRRSRGEHARQRHVAADDPAPRRPHELSPGGRHGRARALELCRLLAGYGPQCADLRDLVCRWLHHAPRQLRSGSRSPERVRGVSASDGQWGVRASPVQSAIRGRLAEAGDGAAARDRQDGAVLPQQQRGDARGRRHPLRGVLQARERPKHGRPSYRSS